jgi:hypothetical protein
VATWSIKAIHFEINGWRWVKNHGQVREFGVGEKIYGWITPYMVEMNNLDRSCGHKYMWGGLPLILVPTPAATAIANKEANPGLEEHDMYSKFQQICDISILIHVNRIYYIYGKNNRYSTEHH